MLFKASYNLDSLYLEFPNGEPHVFRYSVPYRLEVSMIPVYKKDGPNPETPVAIICEVLSQREPSAKVLAMFECIMAGKIPDGTSSEDVHYHTDQEGKQHVSVPRRNLPDPLKSFIQDTDSALHDYATRTIKVLRWRKNRSQSHRAIKSTTGTRFSLDGENWKELPFDMGGIWEMHSWIKLTPSVLHEIETRVQQREDEPMGHTLFREAWELRSRSPKSALMIGIAAAEVGFKQFAAGIVPDAEWLIMNVPSPPLGNMLERFFPQLAKLNSYDGAIFPQDLCKVLRNGINKRNDVTHRGVEIDHEAVTKILEAVENLLWLLDYYSGNAWAANIVSPEVKESLVPRVVKSSES